MTGDPCPHCHTGPVVRIGYEDEVRCFSCGWAGPTYSAPATKDVRPGTAGLGCYEPGAEGGRYRRRQRPRELLAKLKDQARRMRAEGKSLREIGLEVKTDIGTVGTWVRQVRG